MQPRPVWAGDAVTCAREHQPAWPHARPRGDNPAMADGNRMVFLGFGKYARADKIYAIEPIRRRARAGTGAGRSSGSRA